MLQLNAQRVTVSLSWNAALLYLGVALMVLNVALAFYFFGIERLDVEVRNGWIRGERWHDRRLLSTWTAINVMLFCISGPALIMTKKLFWFSKGGKYLHFVGLWKRQRVRTAYVKSIRASFLGYRITMKSGLRFYVFCPNLPHDDFFELKNTIECSGPPRSDGQH